MRHLIYLSVRQRIEPTSSTLVRCFNHFSFSLSSLMASENDLYLNIYYLFGCSFITTQNIILDSRSIYDAYHIKKTYLINLSGQTGYTQFQKLDPREDTDFYLCVKQRKQKWSENGRSLIQFPSGIITHVHIILKSRS